MGLSNDLISQFVKATKNEEVPKNETTVYGTIVKQGSSDFVRIDGSELLTPVTSTTVVKDGDRVTVMIKNHTAIVTGNITSPSAQDNDVKDVVDQITEFEIVIADKVSTGELDAEKGRIDNLVTDNILVKEKLVATEAAIGTLTADNVTINDKLTANEAEFEEIRTKKLDADVADLKFATIENLEVTDAKIHNLKVDFGEFEDLTTKKFTANEASIKKLDAEKLSATDADIKYANIDFSNIGKLAIEEFFAKSGLIENAVIGDGIVTGKLVGVTIVGDLIEGGTIVADKLVIKGTDGLYYKLNTDGESVGSEQTEYNSLNGKNILANSITAEKINVKDLVAFDATIGGFKITDSTLYSGVKESADNTTRGVFLGDDGQFAVGDGSNFFKYYKDASGKYRLEISAESMKISSSDTTVEEELDNLKDEISTVVTIESSRGVMFKNSTISTVLIATVYRGSQVITDITTLKTAMGETACLQWKCKRFDEEVYTDIPSDNPGIGSDGFTLTLNPGEIDTQATFKCELIV